MRPSTAEDEQRARSAVLPTRNTPAASAVPSIVPSPTYPVSSTAATRRPARAPTPPAPARQPHPASWPRPCRREIHTRPGTRARRPPRRRRRPRATRDRPQDRCRCLVTRVRRQHADCEQCLADVDDDDAERKQLALRAQRVRAAGVATALRADVYAAQPTEQQAAEQRPEQIRQQGLQAEFEHQRFLPGKPRF